MLTSVSSYHASPAKLTLSLSNDEHSIIDYPLRVASTGITHSEQTGLSLRPAHTTLCNVYMSPISLVARSQPIVLSPNCKHNLSVEVLSIKAYSITRNFVCCHDNLHTHSCVAVLLKFNGTVNNSWTNKQEAVYQNLVSIFRR